MTRSRREFLRVMGVLSTTFLLAACGFRPLYGRRGADPAAAEMAATGIAHVFNRLDQYLRNDLIERLTPFGEPAQPRYNLSIQVRQSSSAMAIQSNRTITRFNLFVHASFVLSERGTGETLYSGYARAVGSYDAVRSDFATLTAEKDSARRTVREVSEDIHAQLSAFFSRRLAGVQ